MTELWMVVGSLNREAPYFQGARGKGLSVFRLDEASGQAELVCEESGVDNPTYLSVDPRTNCIFATSEVFGWHEGTVSAFRFDPAAGRLRYINKQPSLGSITAHSSLSADGRWLFVANYGMGVEEEGPDKAVAVFPIGSEGEIGPAVSSVVHRGQGPNAERQERAHPHCVGPSPDGRHVIVADLGLDMLVAYHWRDGHLVHAATTALTPSSGPRHFAWHPDGRSILVVCELDSTLAWLAFDAESGGCTQLSTASTLRLDFHGENHCSALQVSPDGRFAYAANRGQDTVAIFALRDGKLVLVDSIPCGRTPRDLALTPSGRTLVAADQNGHTLSIFSVDTQTGALALKQRVATGSPMCVKFLY